MPGKENQLFSIYILRLHLWNFTWQRLLSLEFCNKNINISAPSDNPSSEYSSSRYFPSSLSNMTRVMKWREEKRILGRWGNLGVRSYERSLIHHVTPQHHHHHHHHQDPAKRRSPFLQTLFSSSSSPQFKGIIGNVWSLRRDCLSPPQPSFRPAQSPNLLQQQHQKYFFEFVFQWTFCT